MNARTFHFRAMSPDNQHVIEVDQDRFDTAVLGESQARPVLVDFWAPWCAPCRMLSPILSKLAAEYQGKFLLVTVDTDRNPSLAYRYSVQGIPAVKLFHHGEVVEQFVGLLPESGVRAVLDRHVERASDALRASAQQLLNQGDPERAESVLREAMAADPRNERIVLDLIEVLLQAQRYEAAEAQIRALPAPRQLDEDIRRYQVRAQFGRIALAAPDEDRLREQIGRDPHASEARYQLSARLVARGACETALEQLMALIQCDRTFRDQAGRKAVVDIFTLLGNDSPIVREYRARLSAALY